MHNTQGSLICICTHFINLTCWTQIYPRLKTVTRVLKNSSDLDTHCFFSFVLDSTVINETTDLGLWMYKI